MATKRNTKKSATANSISLQDAYLDFILSRKAKLCTAGMIKIYEFNLKKFLDFLSNEGITSPEDILAKHVRGFLSKLSEKKLSDNYIHSHARNIKTMLRFFYDEKYIPDPIRFDMPRVEKKKLPFLSAEQLPKVLDTCKSKRDKALLLFLIDSGLRRAELCDLNWEDVNINTGVVTVKRGKGGKYRSVVIGAKTRRALLAYHRGIQHADRDALFQTYSGSRLSYYGLRGVIERISKKAEIVISPHALRRTFATLAWKAGMSLVAIQELMGHSSIEMTRRYIQALSDDFIDEHAQYGPIDKFLK